MRPAWEQHRDDILKQSMHGSRGKIRDRITSLSTLGEEDKWELGQMFSYKRLNIWFSVWLIHNRLSFEYFERNNTIPLMLVTWVLTQLCCYFFFLQHMLLKKRNLRGSGKTIKLGVSVIRSWFHRLNSAKSSQSMGPVYIEHLMLWIIHGVRLSLERCCGTKWLEGR